MNSDTASTYSVDQKFDNKPETPPSPYLNVIRIIQYIFSTIALVFVACAIDRNILVPGVTTEEIVLCASSITALLAVFYNIVRPKHKASSIGVDIIAALFLLAATIFGSVQAGQQNGACALPGKMGVWDNTRGCKRMTIATVFTALNVLSFCGSAILSFILMR